MFLLKLVSGLCRKLRPRLQYVRKFLAQQCQRIWNGETKVISSTFFRIPRQSMAHTDSPYHAHSLRSTTTRLMMNQIDRRFMERYFLSESLEKHTYIGSKNRLDVFEEQMEKHIAFYLDFFHVTFKTEHCTKILSRICTRQIFIPHR